MTLEITLDDREWIALPTSFPSGGIADPSAWEDAVVARFRDTWGLRLDGDLEPMVRAALQHGMSLVREDDSIAVQFWPQYSVANVVVHLTLLRDGGPEASLARLVSAARGFGPSVVERVEAGVLGPGVEVRFVIPVDPVGGGIEDEDPLPALAGLRRVFMSGERAIVVDVEPTLPQMIGLLYDSLGELLDSAVVVGDDEWTPSDDGIDDVLPREETWRTESAESRHAEGSSAVRT